MNVKPTLKECSFFKKHKIQYIGELSQNGYGQYTIHIQRINVALVNAERDRRTNRQIRTNDKLISNVDLSTNKKKIKSTYMVIVARKAHYKSLIRVCTLYSTV